MNQVRKIWDAPTRLVHWALVVLIPFSWWTHDDHMDWHLMSGYAVLGLLIFRLLWGFVGSTTARFTHFVRAPGEVLGYLPSLLTRERSQFTGHNPLGGWSSLVLLFALLSQLVSGLFAVDVDGLESGPLSYRVDFDLGRQFANWHETSFIVLQVLIVVHIAAVLFYLVYKRSNLIRSMITGSGISNDAQPITFASWWRIGCVTIVAVFVAWWVAAGFQL